jgi:hypothetical protein
MVIYVNKWFFLSPALSKGKGDETGRFWWVNPIPSPFQRKGRRNGKVLVGNVFGKSKKSKI